MGWRGRQSFSRFPCVTMLLPRNIYGMFKSLEETMVVQNLSLTPNLIPSVILEICFVMLETARILSFSLKGHFLHWEGTNIYAQTFARGLLKPIQIQVIPFSATSLPWKYKEIVLIFWQSSALWKHVLSTFRYFICLVK